jgi:hypothetical protein
MRTALITLNFVMVSIYCFAKNHDTIRFISTSKIDGVKYQAVGYSSGMIVIETAGGKVVLSLKRSEQFDFGNFGIFQFIDFNHDGFKDILIPYITNALGICDLLLYNKHAHTFTQVRNFYLFPSAVHIPHSKYYYSYHRSGCADSNWDSDLFKIVSFKTIGIGNIKALKCGGKEGIFITKIKGNTVKPHKQLPISTINHHKRYKWGFIREYWMHHYKEFK